MKSHRKTISVLGVLAILAGAIVAPAIAKAGKPNVSVAASGATINRGKSGAVTVKLNIPKPYHANANPASEKFLIPTSVKLDSKTGIKAGAAKYPKGEIKKFSFSDKSISVYDGAVAVKVPVSVASSVKAGTHKLSGTVRYQACDEKSCYAPVNVKFSVALKVK